MKMLSVETGNSYLCVAYFKKTEIRSRGWDMALHVI